MGASLLPGGIAGVRAQGFAVSAGTQYPEQAYELVKYLTSNIEVVTQFFGDSPARQSLVGVESEYNPAFFIQLPEEAQALRDQALTVALPASELRFMDYVSAALGAMNPEADNLDAVTALQQAESDAIANLQAADERRSSATILVAQPTPTPVLSADEIAIRVSYTSFISPLPNREQWDQAIQDFTANDPQVGQIVFDTGFGSVEQYTEQGVDCFIQPFNAVPNLDLQSVLNLDPFMNEDPDFTEGDFLAGVLPQVRREHLTWAYPLFLQPEVLWYNTDKFNESGAVSPFSGWALDQFIDALRTLRIDPDDDAPFVPGASSGNTYVLLLTAAFGGLPLDYRTSPPAINFSDPASVDAIRQVLDMARGGYIRYSELGGLGGGGGFFGGELQALYNETLSALSWRLRMSSEDAPDDTEDPYRLTSFPRGRQFTGIAYDIGAGYILSTAVSPDACYRWLSYLSTRPDLFTAMPARRSAINTLSTSATQGEDLAAIYGEIDALLQDPTTVIVPSQFSSAGGDIGAFVLPIWLNRAFDAYVLEDADLEAELSDAQFFATTYMECINSIERIDLGTVSNMTLQEQLAYTRQFTDCAVSVDPSLESMFSFMSGE
jgi:ABC-type glycerol-3-phosphate transport system substrate-binding protein